MAQKNNRTKAEENQSVFRKLNENASKALKKLKKASIADGHEELVENIDSEIYFFCECSDMTCRKRILLKPSLYESLHKKRNRFVVLPGHDIPEIERTVETSKNYTVVEKFRTPPDLS